MQKWRKYSRHGMVQHEAELAEERMSRSEPLVSFNNVEHRASPGTKTYCQMCVWRGKSKSYGITEACKISRSRKNMERGVYWWFITSVVTKRCTRTDRIGNNYNQDFKLQDTVGCGKHFKQRMSTQYDIHIKTRLPEHFTIHAPQPREVLSFTGFQYCTSPVFGLAIILSSTSSILARHCLYSSFPNFFYLFINQNQIWSLTINNYTCTSFPAIHTSSLCVKLFLYDRENHIRLTLPYQW